MKPLNLTARNFRSYSALDVPMSGLQLATLCGENGAGKSSVLKAMLFGLFGAEPGLSADDYIRRGEEETRVEFAFGLNGNSYRVLRTRKFNGKTGKTTLELAKLKAGGATWEAVTGDTIAQTQERINETLCLDQDGFLKSAWISQGDADAFTRAKPTERKSVLAGILDLAIYSRLQDRAKKRLRTIEDEIEQLRGKLELVTAQLERKPEIAASCAEAREKAKAYEYGIKELEEKLAKAHEEEKRLEGAKATADGYRQQIKAVDATLGDISQRIIPLENRVEGLRELQSQLPDLEQKMERRGQLTETIAALDETAGRWNETNRQKSELRSKWSDQKAAVDSTEKDRDSAEFDCEGLDSRIAQLDLALEGMEAGEVHNCPTCKQEIRDQALEETRATYREKREALAADYAVRLKDGERLAAQLAALREPLDEIKAQADQLPVIEYDQGAHDGLKRELEGMNGIEAQITEARTASARVAEIDLEVSDLKARREAEYKEKAAIEEKLREMQGDLDQLAPIAGTISLAETGLTAARADHENAGRTVARLEAELDRLTKLEAESADDRKRQDELHATAATWRYLVEAFGKDGIPALIIDAAIPEVEDIANDILTRLGTGLEVKLETQKALKSSDAIRETLDVRIIEDGFDRPYETYSGGEAYRVNVALRVALSKLLARRAGAHIETLILDEPEGLDEEGRAKLVELLQILSETFYTILLISHHEDLREVFPARIECSKGPDGSRAEVVMV